MTVRLTFDIEFDLEVSVRHEKGGSFLMLVGVEVWVWAEEDGGFREEGVAAEEVFGVVPAALEKNPRMLCCLAVDEPVLLGAGRAGVRLGAADADLPAMLGVQ